MKKKIIALMSALVIVFSCTGCGEVNSPGSNSSNVSSDGSSGSGNTSTDSDPENNSSDPDAITTDPQIVKCGDIIEENGVKTFDVETTCGNAFVVGYHYIRSENGRIENAIPSIKPLGITDLDTILKDPLVVGTDGNNALSKSDFDPVNGVYRMKEEKAKALLGSLAKTYSFDEYWKGLKMAELVSTEGISAEEARPRVDELFENMGKSSV